MDFSKYIGAFRQETFNIDCGEMALRQNRIGGAVFFGKGFIKQIAGGVLTFKVYVVTKENVDPADFIHRGLSNIPGILHSSDEFFDLVATGSDGTQWSAQGILANFDWDFTELSVISHGQMHGMIACEKTSHPHPYLKLHFFEEFDIPVLEYSEVDHYDEKHIVLDKAELSASGWSIKARRHEGDTVFEVECEVELPEAFHQRVQEALQFITRKSAIWRARVEVRDGQLSVELASPRRKSTRTNANAPLLPFHAGFRDHGWHLFECYLTYVVSMTSGTQWNPVAYHLYNAFEASANSIDAWAVGCSVAVEAVSSLASPKKDAAAGDKVSAFQARMRGLLATQTASKDLKARMEGLINALSSERVQDILYSLVPTGHIDPNCITAWGKLRNRHVHPKLKDLKKQSPADAQKLLDLIHKVEVLLHQVTFYLIGYVGPFTDFGTAGFPMKQYPLQVRPHVEVEPLPG